MRIAISRVVKDAAGVETVVTVESETTGVGPLLVKTISAGLDTACSELQTLVDLPKP